MTAQPLVSIIIPAFNAARTIGEALDSVLAQSWQAWEVIVIDDGSTDDTAACISRYTDTRIRVHPQENRGLSAARNAGIERARGELIAFLDADDRILPSKLESQVRYLNAHPEIGLVAGGALRTDEQWRILHRAPGRGRELNIADFALKNQFPVHASIIRRSSLEKAGNFDEQLRAAEDWDIHCRLLLAGSRVTQLEEIVCEYRVMPGSMSANLRNQTEQVLAVIAKSYRHPAFPAELQSLRPRAEGDAFLNGAMRAYLARDAALGREYLHKAVTCCPDYTLHDWRPILERFVYWSRLPVSMPAGESVACFLDNLPPGMTAPSDLSAYLHFLLRKDQVFLARDRGGAAGFLPALVAVIASSPRQALRHALLQRRP